MRVKNLIPRSPAALAIALLHMLIGAVLVLVAQSGRSEHSRSELSIFPVERKRVWIPLKAASITSTVKSQTAQRLNTGVNFEAAENTTPEILNAVPPTNVDAGAPARDAGAPTTADVGAPASPPLALANSTNTITRGSSTSPSCLIGQPPPTVFHPVARGFACWENLYITKGRVSILLPPATGPAVDPLLAEWLKSDALGDGGYQAPVGVLSDADVPALMSGGPLASLAAAHWMREWSHHHFLSHSGHFVEAVASHAFLEAKTDLPKVGAVICSGCDKFFNGENGLNALVVASLWGDAPLLHDSDFNSSTPLRPFDDTHSSLRPPNWLPAWEQKRITSQARDLLMENISALPSPPRIDWCARPASTLDMGPSQPLRLPWAMHIGRACFSDRRSAHNDRTTSTENNINALLVALQTGGMQEGMDVVIGRMRASALLTEVDFPATLLDETGLSIADVLAAPQSLRDPVIVTIKRTNRRSFKEESFTDLIALLRSRYSKRVIAVRMETLSARQQLRLASLADIFVGVQGNGLAHLMWQRRGSAVLEVFPHFDHDGVKGVGWTNDWPYLTRFKGLVYRAMDSLWGHQNPVGHNIADLSHQLHVGNLLLNLTAFTIEMDDLTQKWRWVRGELDAGKSVDMLRHWNPHG